ncbi:hypothetical protein [Candidatus Sodalis pierantonius]|nr:hypothetical protein [Candidatus Sodalis pierantonius]
MKQKKGGVLTPPPKSTVEGGLTTVCCRDARHWGALKITLF